jgi:hypothetical protein
VADNFDFSTFPLSALTSFRLSSSDSSLESVSEALIKSKPNSLTNLELSKLDGSFQPLSLALLECPSLTNLFVFELLSYEREITPIAQMLHRLPLVRLSLVLDLGNLTEKPIECLLSFLSRSAIQDLQLGSLSPKQLQLVADALPSLSCLQSLELETPHFDPSEHESVHLAFFSALTRSSLRSFILSCSSFRLATLKACLNEIPQTQLTDLQFRSLVVYADLDPNVASRDENSEDEEIDLSNVESLLSWNTLFPQIEDKFCCISFSEL